MLNAHIPPIANLDSIIDASDFIGVLSLLSSM